MLADVRHKVIGVFDQLAPEYDTVLPFFTAMAGQAVSALPVTAGTRVLDLGAGIGAVTGQALARGARVTAIDAAPEMIARLRVEHPRARATVMDAHNLALPDAAFGVVVSSFVMHLVDDPEAVAREVRRVLAPGGLFALTLPGAPPGSTAAPPRANELWAEYGQYLTPGAEMGRPLDAVALLERTGFVGTAAQPVTIDLAMPGGGEMLWRWHLSHGTVAFINGLPPDRREEFRQRLIAQADAAGTTSLRATASLWTARTGLSPSRARG